MIRVMVTGAAGRMGSAVAAAVSASEGMTVVARVDPALPAVPLRGCRFAPVYLAPLGSFTSGPNTNFRSTTRDMQW
jgi:nucleoside-diphosphate-sugar epimerase